MKRRKSVLHLGYICILLLLTVGAELSAADIPDPIALDFQGKHNELLHISNSSEEELFFRVTDTIQTDFRIKFLLQEMSVSPPGEDQESACIQVQIDNNPPLSPDCSNHSHGSAGGILVLYANDSIKIRRLGFWNGEKDYAKVFLHVFYEASCSQCEYNGDFCCDSCNSRKYVRGERYLVEETARERIIYIEEEELITVQKSITAKPHCIPKELGCSQDVELSCGTTCSNNAQLCSTDCISGYHSFCWSIDLVWTTLLALIFFVITPAAVIFLICYNGQLAIRRRGRQSESFTTNDPPNDLPPTYDEVEEPPPCFCSVIDPTIGMDPAPATPQTIGTGNVRRGTDNLAFEMTETSVTPELKHSPTCALAKQGV